MVKSLVKNAASERQVKDAKKQEKIKVEDQLDDMKAVLAIPEGRRVMWNLLCYCKTFSSIWSPSAQIHRDAGIQEVGHYLMGKIAEANEEALFHMMKDNYTKGEL